MSARIAWQVMVSHQDVHTSNAAMSPSSLAVTLAMLAEGATGDSLASLDEAFGLTGDGRSAAIGALRQALDGYEDVPKRVDVDDPPETPVLHQANRAVILDDGEINATFLDRLSSYYDSGTTRVPGRTVIRGPLEFSTLHVSSIELGKAGNLAVQLTLPPSDITTGWDLLEPSSCNGID